jgi:hypothetical protein
VGSKKVMVFSLPSSLVKHRQDIGIVGLSCYNRFLKHKQDIELVGFSRPLSQAGYWILNNEIKIVTLISYTKMQRIIG